MNWKKRLLSKSRLYVIIDKEISGRLSLTKIANQIKKSKIDIVQLRDKVSNKKGILNSAQIFKKSLSDTNKIFIINDYLDIARIVDADGIHLGQCDTSLELARKLLGKEKIIGKSTHSLKQTLEAEKQGADYISFGPIYTTPLKPEYKKARYPDLLNKLKKKIKIPLFFIGGINQNNVRNIKFTGRKRVAVCRAILKSKSILKAAEQIRKNL